jgi:hypothetical protein
MSPLGICDGSSWVINSLSVQTEPAGVASILGGGWYTPATDVVLTAPGSVDSSSTSYRFSYWDVDGISQGSQVDPITVTMNAAHSATAHYTLTTPMNIVITKVTAIKKIVGQGFSTPIIVTLTNQGNHSETFNVTVYANTTAIQTETLTLTSQSFATITFTWDTSGFAKGNYTISAYAWPVLGETDTADNNFTGGWVLVTIPGDLNGDFKVSLADLVALVIAYGSRPGDPGWNPNADIDGNSVVGLNELVILANHYGQPFP